MENVFSVPWWSKCCFKALLPSGAASALFDQIVQMEDYASAGFNQVIRYTFFFFFFFVYFIILYQVWCVYFCLALTLITVLMLYVLKVQCDQASLLTLSLMVAAKNTNTLKALSRVRAWFSCSGLLLKHDGATWRTPQKMTCSRCRYERLILKQENTTLFF